MPVRVLSSNHWLHPADISLPDPPDTLLDCRTKTLPFHHHTTSELLHFGRKASPLQYSLVTAICHLCRAPKAQSSSSTSADPSKLEQDRHLSRQNVVTNTDSGSTLTKDYQIDNSHLIRSFDNIFERR